MINKRQFDFFNDLYNKAKTLSREITDCCGEYVGELGFDDILSKLEYIISEADESSDGDTPEKIRNANERSLPEDLKNVDQSITDKLNQLGVETLEDLPDLIEALKDTSSKKSVEQRLVKLMSCDNPYVVGRAGSLLDNLKKYETHELEQHEELYEYYESEIKKLEKESLNSGIYSRLD